MKIAVDVMSGDKPPAELIKGCVLAVSDFDVKVVIVGDEKLINSELKNHSFKHDKIEILPSTEIIGMCESPTKAVRQKTRSSVVIAARAVKEGICQAFFSPGNTGATLSAALLHIGRISGVKRPAIACALPTTMNRPAIIIDAGANVDSIPAYLCQFAIMGEIHYRHMFGIDQPRVGLLNIGEEDSKGCDLTIKTNMMMKKLPLNYIGNIESRYIFNGSVDLIICDGFTGNTVLKQAEGMGKFFNGIIKKEVKKSLRAKVGGLLLKPAFQAIKACTDASEYGGMPLLGINGPVLIGHGSSDARAVRNAVRSGLQNLKCDINKQIQTAIEKWGNL